MSFVIARPYLLGLGLFVSSRAVAESPCDPTGEAPAPVLHLLQLGSDAAAGAAETRLQLELSLLLDGECLVPLPLEDADFHSRSLAEQQAALASALPESTLVLWLDTTDDQAWRVMLLTGAAPRTVLRVVESPGSLEDVPDLAMAVVETLRRIQVSETEPDAPAEVTPESAESTEAPVPEHLPVSEPGTTWALSLAPRLSQSLSVATGPGRIWGGEAELAWSPLPPLWLSLGASMLHGEEADRNLDRIGLRLALRRSLGREWIRPGLDLEVTRSQLHAAGADGQTGELRYTNVEGRAGLDLVASTGQSWQPYASFGLGLSARDPVVRRTSDSQVLLAPGPVTLHLSLGLRRER